MASLNDEGLAEAHGEMMYWDNIYRRSGGVRADTTCSSGYPDLKRGHAKRSVQLRDAKSAGPAYVHQSYLFPAVRKKERYCCV